MGQISNAITDEDQGPAEQLSKLFIRKTGKPAAKWQGYLQHYDRHFARFRHKKLRLLEIGVQAGGSLEIWAEYFKEALIIVGCDIDPSCEALRYEDPRIEVIIGDINDAKALEKLYKTTRNLDVIIDDGSHQSVDIIRSFINLFQRLSDGGIYLIEDLHCSYWEDYGGGLYDPFSSMSFFKKIADIVNRSVWGVEIDSQEFFMDFIPALQIELADLKWDFLSDIYSIEFSNSMCVVHKRAAPNNILGPLILSGAPTAGGASAHKYVDAEISVPEQSSNILSCRSIDNQGQVYDQLFNMRNEISKLKQDNLSLISQVFEATKKYYDASIIIQQQEEQLRKIIGRKKLCAIKQLLIQIIKTIRIR